MLDRALIETARRRVYFPINQVMSSYYVIRFCLCTFKLFIISYLWFGHAFLEYFDLTRETGSLHDITAVRCALLLRGIIIVEFTEDKKMFPVY